MESRNETMRRVSSISTKICIDSDDPSCAKPNPCPLENAISKLDIGKDRAIIVGDMDIDILAGKAAGIATCAVTYGIGKKEDIVKTNPDYLIDNISNLKEIVI